MFGFLFGAACLFGLLYLLKSGRGPDHFWRGDGGSRRSCHHEKGPKGPLERILQRLHLSAEQEKTVREAVEVFRAQVRETRGELSQSRKDVAEALGADYFDPEKLGAVFGRHDTEIDRLRKELVSTLSRIHECLEPEQRRELSSLLAAGRWGKGRPGGPYRGWI